MTSHHLTLPLAALGLLSVATAQITPGNLVVVRVGTGAAALSSASSAVFLDEYTTAGVFVQSLAMPTAANGANLPFSNSGSATSEGILTLSPDGRYLVAGGYAAAPGTATIASTTSATTPRVIARITLDGTIDTTTSLNNVFSANNIRSATTTDGVSFWVAGANSGAVYATLGTTTGLSLNTAAPTNIRVVDTYQGQLYGTSGSGSNRGVNTLGAGLPTTAGQTPALLNGFPTTTTPSPYDFWFADPNTVYVADDRTSGSNGGIQKWTQSGGLWTLQYTLSPSATLGCRGLTGFVSSGVATLFATTTGNALVTVIDTGVAPGTFTTLATAATNTALRGLRFVNIPTTVTFAGTASPTTVGAPTIAPANGLPTIGNLGFAVGAGNLVPNGFGIGLLSLGTLLPPPGLTAPGAPATVEIYVNPMSTQLVLADGSGAGSMPFGIPAINAFAGLPVCAQFVAFDPAMTDPLPLGTSVGMQMQLGF